MTSHDRDYFTDGIECRDGKPGEPPVLVGYAAVFNQETVIRLGPAEEWREMIAPTAFNEAIGRDDVIAAVNHDHNQLLGRTKSGTLRLSADGHGLRYEIALPNTRLGADVREQVRRGDLRGSSFKFSVPDGGARVVKEQGRHATGLPLVVIENVRLRDVGPVAFPAYEGTSVFARSVPQCVGDFVRLQQEEDARAVRDRLALRIRLELAKAWQ
jgi:uncharacterized protein